MTIGHISYNISSESIIEKYTDTPFDDNSPTDQDIILDLAATELVNKVRSGEIWFPYHKFYTIKPQDLFENLKTFDISIEHDRYKLYSYYPTFASYLPPQFRGNPTTISAAADRYEKADILSDHFIEDVRLKAKRYDQDLSPLECWHDDISLKNKIMKPVLKSQYITPQSVREAVYNYGEATTFSPTWAISLLRLVLGNDLIGKKWLDISAGWGDRLLAAMSLDMDYIGFDPNTELQPGHCQMISMFGDNTRHKIIYEPFEKAIIPPGPYDVVLTSPPYFDLEIYSRNQEGQSTFTFPTYEKWMIWFLFESLRKSWDNLKDNGFLILHLGDARTIRTTEATNIFIENNLSGASWEGVIGIKGRSGFARPVWIWKKVPKGTKQHFWEPHGYNNKALPYSQRTLFNTYPELQKELIRYYVAKYAPNYNIHINNTHNIRNYIGLSLPTIPKNKIDDLLNDLLIKSLLESIGTDETVQACIRIVKNDGSDINDYVSQYAPNYNIYKTGCSVIRERILSLRPDISKESVDNLLSDDLMISSLLKVLGADKTITWATAMIQLTFRR